MLSPEVAEVGEMCLQGGSLEKVVEEVGGVGSKVRASQTEEMAVQREASRKWEAGVADTCDEMNCVPQTHP